ncbi:hypothetical protein [Methylorubrum zatmanii]|uniref:Uncharacterized protein n=1 Tax=Methylorubrum zatmanii TaxID=29429 RepID=A0ABW1WUT9_9HYPH|nr:hypothetical protein [Methylorubrum zatmanii]
MPTAKTAQGREQSSHPWTHIGTLDMSDGTHRIYPPIQKHKTSVFVGKLDLKTQVGTWLAVKGKNLETNSLVCTANLQGFGGQKPTGSASRLEPVHFSTATESTPHERFCVA